MTEEVKTPKTTLCIKGHVDLTNLELKRALLNYFNIDKRPEEVSLYGDTEHCFLNWVESKKEL